MSSCPVTGEPNCRCSPKSEIHIVKVHGLETMRKLFTDHAVFTKMYSASFIDGTGDYPFIAKRLLENQVEIGNYMSKWIGKAGGDAVANLLTEHIKVAVKVLETLKRERGVTLAVKQAIAELYTQGSAVARGLSDLSNKLPFDILNHEFHKHNVHVVTFSSQHFMGKYEEEIVTYDAYYTHMLSFSDLLYAGLIYGKE